MNRAFSDCAMCPANPAAYGIHPVQNDRAWHRSYCEMSTLLKAYRGA